MNMRAEDHCRRDGTAAGAHHQFRCRPCGAGTVRAGHRRAAQLRGGDNPRRLEDALREALSRSDLVITTGGLGPTEDDLTKETIAAVLEMPLEEGRRQLVRLKEYFGERPMGPNQHKQVMLPRGSRALPNRIGTAPGCYACRADGKAVAMLPGPPRELLPMLREQLVPILAARTQACICSHMVRTFAQGEGDAALRLAELTGLANPSTATYATDGEMFVR